MRLPDVEILRLPLIVSAAPDALHVQLSEHVRIQDLVLRGARRSALHLAHSSHIEVDNVTCYGSDPVVNLRGCASIRLVGCRFRGISAPWSFRSSHKYRGTPAYLLVSRGDDAANREVEIAHCELTDSHDGPFIGTVRGLKFHHNLVDNFNDDGVYLTSMSLGGDVHIYQNYVSRCLHAFSFFGEYPTGGGVWIYRNVVDLRGPVHYFQPQGPDDDRFTPAAPGRRYRFPSAGRLCGDHGSPVWEPIHFYHNTVIARDPAFRNYYGLGWGGHLRDTQRWVYNNIFVQQEGWPGTTVADSGNALAADGNLHFGVTGSRVSRRTDHPGPPHDLWTDPGLAGGLNSWTQPAAAGLTGNSPAVDAGVPLPADWPDPLRAADRGPPDLGALPVGTSVSAVGPAP